MIMAPYGEHFKAMRKMAQSFIGTKSAVSSYAYAQEQETRYFLARIQEDPRSLFGNIRL